MPVSKVAFFVVAILLGASATGGSLAVAVRPAVAAPPANLTLTLTRTSIAACGCGEAATYPLVLNPTNNHWEGSAPWGNCGQTVNFAFYDKKTPNGQWALYVTWSNNCQPPKEITSDPTSGAPPARFQTQPLNVLPACCAAGGAFYVVDVN